MSETQPALVFVLPLPPIEASLNFRPASRGGRMAQNETVQQYKAVCQAKIRKAISDAKRTGALPEGRLVIHYSWYLGRKRAATRAIRDRLCRPKDHDNAIGAAKPIQDAMQGAGLLPKGDAAGRVRVGDVTLYGKAKDHGGLMQVMVVVMPDPEAIA